MLVALSSVSSVTLSIVLVLLGLKVCLHNPSLAAANLCEAVSRVLVSIASCGLVFNMLYMSNSSNTREEPQFRQCLQSQHTVWNPSL